MSPRNKGIHTFDLPDGSSGGGLVPLCFVILLFPCTPTSNLWGVRGLLLLLSKKWKQIEEPVPSRKITKQYLGRTVSSPWASYPVINTVELLYLTDVLWSEYSINTVCRPRKLNYNI